MRPAMFRATVSGLLLALALQTASAQTASTVVDWGGGYSKGGDSASVTPATSGGAQRKVPEKPKSPPPAPAASQEKLTDWGGGYFKGGDSASVTPATSGAGSRVPGR